MENEKLLDELLEILDKQKEKEVKRMAKQRVIQAVETDSNRIFVVGRELMGGVIADIAEEDGHVWMFDENDEIIVEIKNAPIILYYADAPDENEK